MSRDFQAFLGRQGAQAPQSAAEREALFRNFLKWHEQQQQQRVRR
jgi:hypothetical protein